MFTVRPLQTRGEFSPHVGPQIRLWKDLLHEGIDLDLLWIVGPEGHIVNRLALFGLPSARLIRDIVLGLALTELTELFDRSVCFYPFRPQIHHAIRKPNQIRIHVELLGKFILIEEAHAVPNHRVLERRIIQMFFHLQQSLEPGLLKILFVPS